MYATLSILVNEVVHRLLELPLHPQLIFQIGELLETSHTILKGIDDELNLVAGPNIAGSAELFQRPVLNDDSVDLRDVRVEVVVVHSGNFNASCFA